MSRDDDRPNLFSLPPSIAEQEITIGHRYTTKRDGSQSRPALVLDVRITKLGLIEVYTTYPGQDKRLDAWISISELGEEVVVEAKVNNGAPVTPSKVPNGVVAVSGTATSPLKRRRPEPLASVPSTPDREHEATTRVRNFEDVRVGEYLIKTWYYSPYPPQSDDVPHSVPVPTLEPILVNPRKRKIESIPPTPPIVNGHPSTKGRSIGKERSVAEIYAGESRKASEGSRERLWVCDLCFKYMRTRAGWDRHSSSCAQLEPPGRRVYQKGSYTIWEIDGAQATLYCQNLSLFGKLFIDHKSVFYHLDNFLFYVLCDAATSRRDQVMAFFSKEKVSYDDYNLACIVTFPPHQNRGFGKLLIEFSYYLTHHPSTHSPSFSPGTPERPLSDLGLKGYTAYWIAVILRLCRSLLGAGSSLKSLTTTTKIPPTKSTAEKRSMRARKVSNPLDEVEEVVLVNDVSFSKRSNGSLQGNQSIQTTLFDLARAAHLRVDDTAYTLGELGFLKRRRALILDDASQSDGDEQGEGGDEVPDSSKREEAGEWRDVEIVITRGMVDEAWVKWGVRDKGVLDEGCCLL